jgi:hypothetical protein
MENTQGLMLLWSELSVQEDETRRADLSHDVVHDRSHPFLDHVAAILAASTGIETASGINAAVGSGNNNIQVDGTGKRTSGKRQKAASERHQTPSAFESVWPKLKNRGWTEQAMRFDDGVHWCYFVPNATVR